MNLKRTLIAVSALLASTNSWSTTIEFFNQTAFASNAGTLTTISFDGLTPGNGALHGNEFSALGLSISQRDGLPMNIINLGGGSFVDSFPASINSGTNGLSSSAILGVGHNDSYTDNFDFTFTNTVFAAGLWIGNTGPGSNEVQFLDSIGNIIANEVFTESHIGIVGTCYNCRIFYGITSDQAIATIRTIEGTFDADGIIYDDIQFTSASVPEPSTIALIMIGLAGTFFKRKISA